MTICREWSLVKTTPDKCHAKPLYCRSWNCEICRPKRKSQLLALASSGNPNRFLTLTVNPAIGDSPEQRLKLLSHAWKVIVKRLRRQHGSAAINYLAVVEQTKQGEPHLHMLLRTPFISQAWLSDAMRDLIDAPIVDIRLIRNQREVVRYVAKYITKAPTQFGSAKRYWCTPAYELDKEDWKKNENGPSFSWRISRLSLEEVITEWRHAGLMVARTIEGGAIGERADANYWPVAPPPWEPWTPDVLHPLSARQPMGLQELQAGFFEASI